MSDSVRPHRRQPTRLTRPWDSPGKNTGVGCHFLLQCVKVKSESEVAQSCPTPSDPMDHSLPGSSIHGIFQARVLERGAVAFSEASPYVLSNSPLSTILSTRCSLPLFSYLVIHTVLLELVTSTSLGNGMYNKHSSSQWGKENKLEKIKYCIYMWETKLYQGVGHDLFDDISKA